MALPVAALMGLTLAGGTWVVAGPERGRVAIRVLRGVLAAGLAIWGVAFVTASGMAAFPDYVKAPQGRWEQSARLISAYADAAHPDVPVVMIVSRDGYWGALSPKVYLTQCQCEYRQELVLGLQRRVARGVVGVGAGHR
jgi:hypothetical protein